MDYLKIGQPSELKGGDRRLYRALEILPGFLSWSTLVLLLVFSYLKPVWVAYFIIAFDVYWLLLVVFLALHLSVSYGRLSRNLKTDWSGKLDELPPKIMRFDGPGENQLRKTLSWKDVIHLVVLPTYNEPLSVTRPGLKMIAENKRWAKRTILVYTVEERGGTEAYENAKTLEREFGRYFYKFFLTVHPDGIAGELKGKGANQAWAAEQLKKQVIDKENIDYDRIIVSVFDVDTVVYPNYFDCLTYNFLTVKDPYRASYQPIPVYHNNIWQAHFFSRVAASSNTFWQMMQQIRHEKLATYSSHSMTWRALVDIGFWSKTMVSEDSRIFWHCFCYYNTDYRVVPLYYPVSMDITMDETRWQTAKNLYKQQRRWGWGVENVPYLIFNAIKRRKSIKKIKMLNRIFVQIYGFHSWATNALIIAVIGWMPMILGGDRFNATVLSANLPQVTRMLMTFAMGGLIISAIFSTLLLPKRPKNYGFIK